ncbi:MAG: topoisomerase DNA-binding C4 zinc finger domain-containing protein, partial [Nanoarchaeota archaeon]|nr:topoisomerase DNA-binding C4 zinc finger domain-containing protein [Nanoarchaeota archaeon]
KNLEEKEEKILDKAKKSIIQIAEEFKKKETKIGDELMNAQEKQREIEKKENTLIQCPKCKKGNLAITYSPKNKRFFIACDAYPECKNTFSLPPRGTIKRTEKSCDKCGFPILMALTKGKKPWFFCFNPECETNAEWAKKREEYMKKQQK